MAPTTKTRGRPAGRPVREAATLSAKKDAPITAADESGTAPKRGRGRPPKNGVSKVVKTPSGRGRGRPPKDPSAAAAAPKKAAAKPKVEGRGRGRPRKSDASAAATPAKKAATPKKAASVTKPAGSGRRGRPARKSEAAEEEVEANGEEDHVEEDIPVADVMDEDTAPESGAEADVEVGDALDDGEALDAGDDAVPAPEDD